MRCCRLALIHDRLGGRSVHVGRLGFKLFHRKAKIYPEGCVIPWLWTLMLMPGCCRLRASTAPFQGHAALWTFTGLVRDDFRMHWAIELRVRCRRGRAGHLDRNPIAF